MGHTISTIGNQTDIPQQTELTQIRNRRTQNTITWYLGAYTNVGVYYVSTCFEGRLYTGMLEPKWSSNKRINLLNIYCSIVWMIHSDQFLHKKHAKHFRSMQKFVTIFSKRSMTLLMTILNVNDSSDYYHCCFELIIESLENSAGS